MRFIIACTCLLLLAALTSCAPDFGSTDSDAPSSRAYSYNSNYPSNNSGGSASSLPAAKELAPLPTQETTTANTLYGTFKITITSGPDRNAIYHGQYACLLDELDPQKPKQHLAIQELCFNYRTLSYARDGSNGRQYLYASALFRYGKFIELRFVGGPSHERFGLNVGYHGGYTRSQAYFKYTLGRCGSGSGSVCYTQIARTAKDNCEKPKPREAKCNEEVITVPATSKSKTIYHCGIMHVDPDPAARWNTSPFRWEDIGFMGHLHERTERARNRMHYMQLCYSLNGGPLIPITGPTEIQVNGSIFFAPSDHEGGGLYNNNEGSMRVFVEKVAAHNS